MANKVLEYIIRAKDVSGSMLTKAKRNFERLGKAAKSALSGIAQAARQAKWYIAALAGAVVLAFREFAKIEADKNPFIRFTGSVDLAKQHIKDLQQIASYGVIKYDDLKEASKYLFRLSDGAYGAAQDMKLLADAAATNDVRIGELAQKIGEFYQKLKYGLDIKEALFQLERLGVISKGVGIRMAAMQKDGSKLSDIWRELQKEVSKFAGGVEADSKLAASAFERLKYEMSRSMEAFGEEVSLSLLSILDELIAKIQELREDGSIEEWADTAADAINSLIPIINNAIKATNYLKNVYKTSRGGWKQYGAYVGGVLGQAAYGTSDDVGPGFIGRGLGRMHKAGLGGMEQERGSQTSEEARQFQEVERRKAVKEERRAEIATAREEQQQKVKDAMEKELDILQKQRDELNAQIKAEQKKKKLAEGTARAKEDELRTQQELRLEQAQQNRDTADALRKQAVSPAALKEAARESKAARKEEDKFQSILYSAHMKLRRASGPRGQRPAGSLTGIGVELGQTGVPPGYLTGGVREAGSLTGGIREAGSLGRQKLTPAELAAVASEKAREEAAKAEAEAQQLEKDALIAAKESRDHLASIDAKIVELMTLKGGA